MSDPMPSFDEPNHPITMIKKDKGAKAAVAPDEFDPQTGEPLDDSVEIHVRKNIGGTKGKRYPCRYLIPNPDKKKRNQKDYIELVPCPFASDVKQGQTNHELKHTDVEIEEALKGDIVKVQAKIGTKPIWNEALQMRIFPYSIKIPKGFKIKYIDPREVTEMVQTTRMIQSVPMNFINILLVREGVVIDE